MPPPQRPFAQSKLQQGNLGEHIWPSGMHIGPEPVEPTGPPPPGPEAVPTLVEMLLPAPPKLPVLTLVVMLVEAVEPLAVPVPVTLVPVAVVDEPDEETLVVLPLGVAVAVREEVVGADATRGNGAGHDDGRKDSDSVHREPPRMGCALALQVSHEPRGSHTRCRSRSLRT
jgi:hypothetical protein